MSRSPCWRAIRVYAALTIPTLIACDQRTPDPSTPVDWVRYELQRLDGLPLPASLDDVTRDGTRCTTTTLTARYELSAERWRRAEERTSTCGGERGTGEARVLRDSGAVHQSGERLTFTRFDSALQRYLELPPGRLVRDTLIFDDGVPEAIFVRVR